MTGVPDRIVFDAEPLIAHATDEHGASTVEAYVNYPALLAPSRLAAIGHSLRAGLSRNDSVPRDPVRGRGPASS